MSKVYRVNTYGFGGEWFDEFEMISHTDKTVTYLESWGKNETRKIRHNLVGEWHHFFFTKKEAAEFIVERELNKIENAKKQIDTSQWLIVKFHAMSEANE